MPWYDLFIVLLVPKGYISMLLLSKYTPFVIMVFSYFCLDIRRGGGIVSGTTGQGRGSENDQL